MAYKHKHECMYMCKALNQIGEDENMKNHFEFAFKRSSIRANKCGHASTI